MEITSAIITASSTLLGVIVTFVFTNTREKSKFRQELRMRDFSELETFYVTLLSSIEKTLIFTERGEDYKELVQEQTMVSAKANIIAPISINEKLGDVSDMLYRWSSLYRQSLPIKIDGTKYGIASNQQSAFRNQADIIYPELKELIGKLIELIRVELSNQRILLNN